MKRCPSPHELEELLDEELGDAERDSISQHVDACPRCQQSLDTLTELKELDVGSVILRREEQRLAIGLRDSETAFLTRLKHDLAVVSRSGKETLRPDEPRPGFPEVEGYEILEELGRGGMGVVYKARQVGLNRLVALKMILTPDAGPSDLARFRQEAEAVARMRHPNIIQIYDVGEASGRPYFALEFVEGGSLANVLRATPQPLAESARLVETLARAIHYAHQQDVVHRDLKPANVLLQIGDCKLPFDTQSQSAICDLQSVLPKITDFGLAKRLDAHGGTLTGEVVGTPGYMAPEQARMGRPGPRAEESAIGPRADVYALGAILYEMATGRPPFRGPTALDTVLQILHEEPVRPSYLRHDLPRDLETICLKCLAKEPGKRYASASALADDLHAFRRGRPITARPVGLPERLWKWARHRPLSASLIAGMILIAVLGFGGVTWQWQEARLARDHLEVQKRQADAARAEAVEAHHLEAEQRKKARAALYFSRIAQAQLQWRVNDVPSARATLAKCLPGTGQKDYRGWEWHYLQALFHNDLLTLRHATDGAGAAVAFDPKGRWIASVVGGLTTAEGNPGGEIRIWNAVSGELTQVWSSRELAPRLAFGPDGNRLALAGNDGSVMIWDLVTGQQKFRTQVHREEVAVLAFSPDGKHIASASRNSSVKIWDSANGKMVAQLDIKGEGIRCLAFHPDSNILATGGGDAAVKLWNVKTGREFQSLSGHKLPIQCLAFSPDGLFLVSAASNGNLKIWELYTGRIIQSLTADTGAVLTIAYNPDGRSLAKGGKDGSVRIWDLESGVERMVFRGHASPVDSVAFSPDGQRLVSIAPADGKLLIWDLTRNPDFATFARTDSDVEAIVFHEDRQRFLSATMTGNVQAWDLESGFPLGERSFPLHKKINSPAVGTTFSPGGRSIAGRSQDDPKTVKVWNTETGAETASFSGHGLPVSCVRFSGNGKLLATCACDFDQADAASEIKLWDIANGKMQASFPGRGRIYNMALAPDGGWLAWGTDKGLVILGSAKSGAESRSFAAHQGAVSAVAFSPNGRLLASAGLGDRAVKIWKLDKVVQGRDVPLLALAAPNTICDLTFSPNGKRLVAVSRDLVKMWDVDTGHEVLTLRGATQRYADPAFNPRVTFSPDGVYLAGSNWDESISIWQAPLINGAEGLARLQHGKKAIAERRIHLWHLQEAEICADHKNLSAARFHFNRLEGANFKGTLQARKDRLAAILQAK